MRMFIEPLAIYLHCEPIDFRVGIDGLAMRVEQEMALSSLTGAFFDNDQVGHGTVGYGNEYPKGLSCSTLASTHNALYEHYLAHPLHPNGPRALALLQKDIVTKAATPINQSVAKELTAQQFNALIPWVFNIGKGGWQASDALAAINSCNWTQVPGDFTHYDHIGSQVSCGLYARDRVSGHYWNQGAWVSRSTFTSSCPAGSIP